jgi:hypothetical protein
VEGLIKTKHVNILNLSVFSLCVYYSSLNFRMDNQMRNNLIADLMENNRRKIMREGNENQSKWAKQRENETGRLPRFM